MPYAPCSLPVLRDLDASAVRYAKRSSPESRQFFRARKLSTIVIEFRTLSTLTLLALAYFVE
jgi:hypothetical protein